MDRKENIRNAYRLTGSNNFYDGMVTCSTVSGKAVCRLVWDMGKEECGEYLNKAFTGVPEDFAGKLLEVPVGTGILTMPLYQTLPRADITCLDYSPDMMGQAREKAERMGLQNVQFRQGDVGALPYEDSSFDIVLSLNGFHAFPDKEAAYRETFRVLKPGGYLLRAYPLREHLWELKALIYDTPRDNPPTPLTTEGFTLVETREVRDIIHLSCNEDILSLFRMTPYYYKTGAKDQQKAEQAQELSVKLAFGLAIYQRD